MSNILLPHNNISIISQEASETWKLYIGKVVNKKRWEMEMLCRAPARKKLKLCHQYSVTYKTNSFIWWEAYTWILQSFIHSKSEDVHIGLNLYKSQDINWWPYINLKMYTGDQNIVIDLLFHLNWKGCVWSKQNEKQSHKLFQ